MGRFTQSITDSDTAFDVLEEIKRIVNLESFDITDDGLQPEEAEHAKIKLNQLNPDMLSKIYNTYDDEGVIVYASILLHVGADINEEMKNKIIFSIDRNLNDYKVYLKEYRKEDPENILKEREMALIPLRQSILDYDGHTRHVIRSPNSFGKKEEVEKEISVYPMF